MAVRPVDTISPPRARVPFRRYVELLVTYLRPQKALVAVVAVSLLSNIGLQLVNPQLLRYFIDEAKSGSPVGRLVTIAILFTVVALVQQVFNVVATYTSGRVGWTATNALRGDLARHRLHNLTVDRFRAVREASAQTFGFIEERLAGREDIRTSAARSYVMLGFHTRIRDWFRKNLKASLMISLVLNTTWFSFAVGNAVALGIGSWLFLNNHITIGTMFLIVHYTHMLLQPIERFTQELNNLQKATASVIRILDLLQIERQVLDGPGVRFPDGALPVRFDGVSFAYNPGEPVLQDISFELAPRRVLGLIGRTGSGKTTMTRLMFRLYDPHEDRVLLGGQDVRDARIAELREQIGVVTQDVRLFEGTVRDNLTLLDHGIPDDRLVEVVEELGLGSWYRSLGQGLDSVLRSEGASLSAGEAQLLAFARVFLRDPGVVVLDEASSRIDPGTEQLIERAVDRLVEGRTVIVIAHRLATLDRCDEIMILERGRIVEHGARSRLAEDPNARFHKLLQTDMGEVLT